MKMKRTALLLLSALLACSCYESYVKDYDYSGIYIAYQYDLRSLVVGEGMEFTFGSVLGGVINNTVDRTVEFVMDDELLTGELDKYGGTYAIDGLKESPSQTYVSAAVNAADIHKVVPLPHEYYKVNPEDRMVIKKGNHTATARFTVDSLALLSDVKVGHDPYYAIGWKITKADADTVLLPKSFGIIALRIENMFFGSWYHGGVSWTESAGGVEVAGSRKAYPTTIPSANNTSEVYSLTTADAYGCDANFRHNSAGTMRIGMDGKTVSVSGEGITDCGSSWNKAPLLQGRKIFLNYKYENGDGTCTVVRDTLTFRNRERDGVNEWQDANKEHYKK